MKHTLPSLWNCLVSAAICYATTGSALGQQGNNGGEPSWRRARGQQIEAELGDRLPDVARRHGLSEQEFHDLVRRDKSIATDRDTNLLYACPPPAGLALNAGTVGSGNNTVVAPGIYPEAETFLLHSRPASTRKIFLDFNGHTTSGTSWNSSYTAGTSFATPPFDLDGSATTTFSSAELSRIQYIWKRVCEDFSPFDVDVTTEDPGVEALRRATSTDTAYGIRVCIGGSSNDWFKSSAGGVAYVGSFNWNTDTPCFIFPVQLGTGNEKYTAEAISHEVGHTLGLNHDGQIASATSAAVEYYQGHNNWAPIMGVGYYKTISQWSKGEYPLANNTQDDLAVMQTYGAPLRTDEHGNAILNATPLTGTSLTATGVISTRTDADLFKFTTGAGTVAFNVGTATPDANLDIQLSVYDGAGSLVTSSDPAGLPGTLSATMAAGTYYLSVDGVGFGTTSTGYTDYGSLGQFYLSGTVVASGNQPPVVVAAATPTSGTSPLTVAFSSTGTFDADGAIVSYSWDFGDGTAQSALASPTHVYNAPGTYIASLVAFDNGGLSTSATVTITVSAQTTAISVSGIAMTADTNKRGTNATARVTVWKSSGALMPGVSVRGNWSGLATGNVTAVTDSLGQATFNTPRVRGSGTFTFSVTGLYAAGTFYDATKNVETSDSISVP